jgi:putative flippase GtrA
VSERWGRLLRFALVGFVNTAVDFVILFALTALGMQVFFANVISTSAALGLSFVLNRNFTFRSGGERRRQIVLFFAVTLVGLWILQPLVIAGVQLLLPFDDQLSLLIGKVCATVVSLTWNYLLYSRLVFPDEKKPDPVG